jgi:hypothetical protein
VERRENVRWPRFVEDRQQPSRAYIVRDASLSRALTRELLV